MNETVRCEKCGGDRFEDYQSIRTKGAVVSFTVEYRCASCGEFFQAGLVSSGRANQ